MRVFLIGAGQVGSTIVEALHHDHELTVMDNEASRLYTVVAVYTRDRPHLLHALARTLHEAGLSIALAKVNTEGQRVADVFYVQTATGGKVSGRGELGALSRALHETIRGLDDAASGAAA